MSKKEYIANISEDNGSLGIHGTFPIESTIKYKFTAEDGYLAMQTVYNWIMGHGKYLPNSFNGKATLTLKELKFGNDSVNQRKYKNFYPIKNNQMVIEFDNPNVMHQIISQFKK